MADSEKVIKALECCQMAYERKPYEKCPYSNGLECGDCDINRLHYDAITLLKEQEAVVRCKDCKHQHEYRTGSCPYYTTYGSVPPYDWFCADGKRREDDA